MGTPLVNLAIVVLVGWLVWRTARPRPQFLVRIEAGRPQVRRGTVTPAFLGVIESLCQQHELQRGEIVGVADGSGRIALRFSWTIPSGARQQLRNWWTEFGWPGPPNHPPPRRRRIATR